MPEAIHSCFNPVLSCPIFSTHPAWEETPRLRYRSARGDMVTCCHSDWSDERSEERNGGISWRIFFDRMNRIFQDKKVKSIIKSCSILYILSKNSFFRTNLMGKRPIDSAGAPLGVTWPHAVIPTGATNGVRSGMEESHEESFLAGWTGTSG